MIWVFKDFKCSFKAACLIFSSVAFAYSSQAFNETLLSITTWRLSPKLIMISGDFFSSSSPENCFCSVKWVPSWKPIRISNSFNTFSPQVPCFFDDPLINVICNSCAISENLFFSFLISSRIVLNEPSLSLRSFFSSLRFVLIVDTSSFFFELNK